MNVEIGTEAAQFPEKEYINLIFLAVHIILNLGAITLWRIVGTGTYVPPSFMNIVP
jgi:hypothetical protein